MKYKLWKVTGWLIVSESIAQIALLSIQAAITTQTQASEVRWAARFSGHWVVTIMFA